MLFFFSFFFITTFLNAFISQILPIDTMLGGSVGS